MSPWPYAEFVKVSPRRFPADWPTGEIIKLHDPYEIDFFSRKSDWELVPQEEDPSPDPHRVLAI